MRALRTAAAACVAVATLALASAAEAAWTPVADWDTAACNTTACPDVGGFAVGPSRAVYVTTFSGAGQPQYVELYAGMGTADAPGTLLGDFGEEGTGNGQFERAIDADAFASGDLAVVDIYSSRVQGFDADGDFQWTLGGFGTGGASQFKYPTGVTVTPNGIYVMDSGNNRVQQFDPVTRSFIRMWGKDVGPADEDVCSASCKAGAEDTTDGAFFHMSGIGHDAAGNVYVADGSDRVQKFTKDGAFVLTTPDTITGVDVDDLGGIAVDGAGRIYVANAGRASSRANVLVFSSAGAFLQTISSYGDGPGEIASPNDVAFDSLGNLYVNDFGPAGGSAKIAVFSHGTGGGGGGGGGGSKPPPGDGGTPPDTTPKLPEPARLTVRKRRPRPVSGPRTVVTTGITVGCQPGGPVCQTIVTVTVVPGKASASAVRRIAKAKLTTQPGTTRKVRFRLTRKGFRLLRKRGRLKVRVKATTRVGNAAPARAKQTLKLVYKPKKRKKG